MKDANWTPLWGTSGWVLRRGERGPILGYIFYGGLEDGVEVFKAYAWVEPESGEDETFIGTFDDPRKATRAVERVFSASGRLAVIRKALGD